MDSTLSGRTRASLRALPGDEARRIMWRVAGHGHLQDNLAITLAAFELARVDGHAERATTSPSQAAAADAAGPQHVSLDRERLATAGATAARLLSGVEPILRRLAAAGGGRQATDRDGNAVRLGALDRLVGRCAAGEATAALAFAAARANDERDPMGAVLAAASRLWSAHAAGMLNAAPDAVLAAYDDEALDQRQVAEAMTTPAFRAQFQSWIADMRRIAAARPGTGACTLGSAMELWLWVLARERSRMVGGGEAQGEPRPLVAFGLADALCWLLAARCQILDALELESAGPGSAALAADLPALNGFLGDLCHVQAARAAGEVGRIAADLVHGYNRHPAWDAEGCAACYGEADLAELEQLIPGIESTAGAYDDVIALDGTHKPKAGPCVRFKGLDDFVRLRGKLDGCLTGSRVARDRAAEALASLG